MKAINLKSLLLSTIILVACHSTKKSTTTVVAPESNHTPTKETGKASVMISKSATGIYEPGEAELAAIQTKYKETTMAQIQQGYYLYSAGACISCHKPKSIYQREESAWKGIIDDMAEEAKITSAEKEAVYKFVLAIKATQVK